MENPDPVEVDEEMGNGALFKISFEENTVPFDLAEFHKTLRRRDVDQPLPPLENNFGKTFGVPK